MQSILPSFLATARRAYLALPLSQGTKRKLIHVVYRALGPLFRGTPHYQSWRRSLKRIDGRHVELDQRPFEEVFASLAFEPTNEPDLSILIPTYGNLDLTARCIAAVQRTCQALRFEVVVVEDASPDMAMSRLKTVPGLRFLRNEVNLGFVRTCNRAAQAARGRWLVFLNNDTEPQSGWLSALHETFVRFPDAGLVGAKLIYPSGRLQEAGGIVWCDGSAWNHGRDDDAARSDYCFVRKTDYCSGAALMIGADDFANFGLFDEAYVPAYYEDTDLAFKVWAAGRSVYVQPFATVVHHEGASAGTDLRVGMKAYQLRHREVFKSRWVRALMEQRPYATGLRLAAERLSPASVILVVDQYVPRFDRDAGSRSVFEIIQTLLAAGWTVKFWPNTLWFEEPYTEDLQRRGVEVFYGDDYVNRFRETVIELGPALHSVLLNRPLIARDYLPIVRRHSRAKVVLYGHDVHYQRMAMQRATEGIAGPSEPETEQMRTLEEQLWRDSDVVLYPSNVEVETVRNAVPGKVAVQVPLYAFDRFADVLPPDARSRTDILFVANFAHPPNVDAMIWFAREVLPIVTSARPDARLVVVGNSPPAVVRELASDSIILRGAVDAQALIDHYREARLAVVPLRFGAGVKGKAVEALAYGLPLVTTSVGAQGIADVESAVVIVDEVEPMAAAILALLGDDARWLILSTRAQALARTQFSRARLEGTLRAAFGERGQR